jgi:hypothetical protein
VCVEGGSRSVGPVQVDPGVLPQGHARGGRGQQSDPVLKGDRASSRAADECSSGEDLHDLCYVIFQFGKDVRVLSVNELFEGEKYLICGRGSIDWWTARDTIYRFSPE